MEFAEKMNILRRIPAPIGETSKSSLLTLTKNAVLRIQGDLFIVDEVLDYEELSKKGDPTGFCWKEYGIVNLQTFEKRYLEVEDDDGIQVYLTDDKVVAGRLSEIPSIKTKTLTVKNLANEQPFYLDESCSVLLKNDDKAQEERFQSLDYESDDEATLLGIEVRDDGNCSAYTYHQVQLNTVEVVTHETS